MTPSAPISMPTNTQKVTRPPPPLSDIQPVAGATRRRPAGRGRRIAGRPLRGRRSWQQREACRIADERTERSGIEPAHHPIVLALKMITWSFERRLAEAMSFMPNQAAKAEMR